MTFDVIYTWVDGADPEYIAIRDRHAATPTDLNPERYRDDLQLMRYSLRSLEAHFDGFRHLIIVTARPQVPAWLNLDDPRVRVVHHDEFIPADYLPTFNSNAIESFLHRIPGLAEHFLYMNDDFLFGRPLSLEAFIRDGKYRIFNTLFGENLGWRIYDGYRDIIGLGLIEHVPLFTRTAYWQEAFDRLPEQADATRRSRFRDRRNLCPFKVYRYLMLKHHRGESVAVTLPELLRENRFHKLTNEVRRQRRAFEALRANMPMHYCLNDDFRARPDPAVLAMARGFLEERYPQASSFERETANSPA